MHINIVKFLNQIINTPSNDNMFIRIPVRLLNVAVFAFLYFFPFFRVHFKKYILIEYVVQNILLAYKH